MRLSHATRWLLDALLLVLLVGRAGDAAACPDESPCPRIIIVEEEGAADLRALVEGELRALGFHVAIEAPGQASEAAAVLTVDPGEVAVWTPGVMRRRRYAADPRHPPGSDEALARQVAEVLRAELLLEPKAPTREPPPLEPPPVSTPSGPTPSPVPPPGREAPAMRSRAHPPEPPRSPPWGRASLAPAVELSPGPIPPRPQLAADLSLHLAPGWRARALVVAPLASVREDVPEGTVAITTGRLGAALAYAWTLPWLEIAPSGGVAWQWLQVVGRGAPGLSSQRQSTSLVSPFAGITLAIPVARRLRILGGGRVAFAFPETRLAVAGRDLGIVDRPAVQLRLGLAIDLGGS